MPRLSEETIAGLELEALLASNPKVIARRKAYNQKVEAARVKARGMPSHELIDELCARTPSYIRNLLETEDERHGPSSLIERYARTFYEDVFERAAADLWRTENPEMNAFQCDETMKEQYRQRILDARR